MTSNAGQTIHLLLEKARKGCRNSTGELLETYRSYLRLVARLQLDGVLQDKVSPSDIVQATYLQAQKGIVAFHGSSEGELIAWLRKILASQLATEIRRYTTQARNVKLERQLNQRVDQSSMQLAAMFTGNAETPSQEVMRRERSVILAQALEQLPDDYQRVIVLRHFKSYRFQEIAEEMDRTLDSVKSIWRRAIIQLRGLLGDELH